MLRIPGRWRGERLLDPPPRPQPRPVERPGGQDRRLVILNPGHGEAHRKERQRHSHHVKKI